MITNLVFALGVLVVAWLGAGGMAVRSASRIWLRHWAEQRLRGAASVIMYLERPHRLLAAANAGAALTLGVAGFWIGWRTLSSDRNPALNLAAYAAIMVLFGYIVPRIIARRWPSAVIPATMPALRAAELLTAPLLSIGKPTWSTADERKSERDQPHEAMTDLLREGELEGVGKHEEIAIISGVMEFGDKMVRDVMTPRNDVFAIPEGMDAATVARMIAESAFSRVPVYRGSMDTIVGMYHAFDVLKERAERLPPLRPVAYTAADTRCNELLFRMLRARLHLAVVHDDHGQTLGIATLENMLEELVGDIRDEHDDPATVTPSGLATL